MNIQTPYNYATTQFPSDHASTPHAVRNVTGHFQPQVQVPFQRKVHFEQNGHAQPKENLIETTFLLIIGLVIILLAIGYVSTVYWFIKRRTRKDRIREYCMNHKPGLQSNDGFQLQEMYVDSDNELDDLVWSDTEDDFIQARRFRTSSGKLMLKTYRHSPTSIAPRRTELQGLEEDNV